MSKESKKVREAAIDGDYKDWHHWTPYARDFGVGAGTGAILGAETGPGAAITGLIGGIGSMIPRAFGDVRYNMKSPEDKAISQSASLIDRITKISQIFSKHPDTQQIGQALTMLGQQYQQYIQSVIKKTPVNLSQNVFSLHQMQSQQSPPSAAPAYMGQANQNIYSAPYVFPTKKNTTSSSKGKRIAQEDSKEKIKNVGEDLAGSGGVDWGLRKLMTSPPSASTSAIGEAVAQGGIKSLLNPANLLKGTIGLAKGGIPGIIAGAVADFGLNGIEQMSKGDVGLIKDYSDDINKIIALMPTLTGNNPQVVSAGQMIQTVMSPIISKILSPTQQQAPPQVVQPDDTNSPVPNSQDSSTNQQLENPNYVSDQLTGALGALSFTKNKFTRIG